MSVVIPGGSITFNFYFLIYMSMFSKKCEMFSDQKKIFLIKEQR